MKKTFEITTESPKRDRQIEAVKHEIKKYIVREKRKTLPEGETRRNFTCKVGKRMEHLAPVKISEINPAIDKILGAGSTSFAVEILAIKTDKPED